MTKSSSSKLPWWRRLLPGRWREPRPVVAVLRLTGAIGAVSPLKSGLTLHQLDDAIEKAFALKGAKAVALAINSPGGSPVQSALIYRRIRELAEEKELPVYAFAEDVAASGGYMLALAGDEIYGDVSSIIGSIGVISAGFGFDKAIKKLGVERRVHTAGLNKLSLDPFSPEKEEDVKRLKDLQLNIHEAFIAMVRERRGDKLNGPDEELFSGAFWSGGPALELGLIDGLQHMRSFLRAKYGDKVALKVMTAEKGWLKKRLGLARGPQALLPRDWAGDMIAALEERGLWSRFGM
ncbi:MAG: S49 family peptidase [Hyphomicrobiales bacterium]|nr:MAG: S49 family peptidase [Hyphomicrobiales bacterium]